MLNVLRKTPEFLHRKLNECNKQKHIFANITTVILKPLLASFKIAYRNKKGKVIPVLN
jgi:hypothetical protein